MEKLQKRQTDAWFVNKNFVGENSFKSGPGAYNIQDYQPKQTWNKGAVPFGSNSMLENGSVFTLDGSKGMRNIPTVNSQNPGPGHYDVPKDLIGNTGKSPLR